MKFIHEDYLLETRTARRLYHRFAETEPILDYHCHPSPRDIAENRQFKNLFEIWIQLGSGWWSLDQKEGMEGQLNALSNLGLLSRFVGIVTDSRSFMSYPRHEYFRRVLCNLIGQDIEKGELPDDEKLLGPMIRNISYGYAHRYLALPPADPPGEASRHASGRTSSQRAVNRLK